MSDRPTYREALRTEHVLRSFSASILGRMSLAASQLALVLVLARATDSFAIAGVVVAALGISNVVATPWRARLVDRRGQPAVLGALCVIHAGVLVVLGVAAAEVELPMLVGLSVVGGVSTPPFATTMRVLWLVAMPTAPLRQRGLSLDAVAGEMTYAVGPLAAAVLAAAFDPLASLVAAATAVMIGGVWFVTSPLSRLQRGARGDDPVVRTVSPLRSRGFFPIVLALTAPGIVLGLMDIAAPALAAAASSTVLSGILLALFAGASGVGGLLFGALPLRIAPERQLPLLTLLLLIAVIATGLSGGTFAAIGGFVVSGVFLAPVLISGYLAANERAAPETRTEANGWMDTAVQLGVAVGAAVFGTLTVVFPPGAALAIGAALPAILITVTAPFLLRKKPPAPSAGL